MSWSNDVILEFLDHYRIEQLLWDPKHPLHRNRSEVTEAWHRIQHNLSINCSLTDMKKKKESLMTSFRFHYNRKKKALGNYKTSWFAYSFMESFLGGKYECDSTNQNVDHEYLPSNISFGTEDPVATASPEEDHSITLTNRRTNRSCANPQTTDSEYIYAKRKLELEEGTSIKEIDEYELYGQLLAKKLRKLEEHQRDMAMHEIDNIMFNAKMQSGPTQSKYSMSSSPVPRKIQSPVFIVTQQSHGQYEDENMT